MPGGPSQESSLKGLKRINTGISEHSHHGPKSSGAGSGRLSLHIPNAYPRALSPRSPTSKNGTPESSRPASPRADEGRTRTIRQDSSLITIRDDDPHPEDSNSETVQLRSTALKPLRWAQTFLQVKETSSSSARDFLARERNFFSWLRLSCLLAILSASLILQLQLPDTARSYSTPRRRQNEPVDWDHLPLSTKVFAGIFFALSIISLGAGTVDYLNAERGLEKEQVDFDETEGVFLNDGHTSRIVHAVMLVVGTGIGASALWLLAY
ncbi:protein of unknown function DUF202 [Kalmanozyma brasiliensis GHG001]|uniref:protein of unknown function DUF202 n=1 Tax=Kalmanozyma brasiliensis (strain GHG001) TaxID=1365824 RepID=UPI002867F5CC|nr:protein of unknown function DUF202 [Kalmanozyma brasiliensis GHG001]KAF6766954.1 protein of unknown function DUF202 [Kalmanozyma brasiliensis GHG001]